MPFPIFPYQCRLVPALTRFLLDLRIDFTSVCDSLVFVVTKSEGMLIILFPLQQCRLLSLKGRFREVFETSDDLDL